MYPLAERTKNLGCIRRKCADETALNDGLDICVDSGPVQLLFDCVGGYRESSMTSKNAMGYDTNAKLQVIVLLRNVNLAVLSHPDFAGQVRCE